MQCANSSSNGSGGGIVDRKPSYFAHPGGSVTLSSLSSLGSLNLTNIGGLSISNIPGTVSTNIHHASTPPPTTMYYDQIKYSMWRRSLKRKKRNVIKSVNFFFVKFCISNIKELCIFENSKLNYLITVHSDIVSLSENIEL